MAADVVALPILSPGADLDEIRAFCQKLREQNWAREPVSAGDALTKFVTRRDLVSYDLVGYSNSGDITAIDPPPDLSGPTPLSGLIVTAALEHFIVEWDPITYTQGGGNGYTEVFGANYSGTGPLPTFADATLRGTASGTSTILAISAQPGETVHFWIGGVTANGVHQVDSGGPTGGLNGVAATTGQDVTSMLDALTAAAFDPASPYTNLALRADLFTITPPVDFYQDTTPTGPAVNDVWFAPSTGIFQTWNGASWDPFAVSPPFFVTTTTIVQNGVSVPPGVYITSANIANGTITNAQIGNLAVDTAKVASLSAAKLIAGSIAVGEYIQSTGYLSGSAGWKIDGAGNAELNNVTVRGTIYAGAGSIGGAIINSTYVQSSGYVAGTSGWKLDNATGKLWANSATLQNNAGTNILDLDAVGTSPVLKIGSAVSILANGTATFAGTLTGNGVVDTSQLIAHSVTNTVSVASSTTQTVTGAGGTGPNTVATAPSITVSAGSNVLLQGCISYSFEATDATPSGETGTVEIKLLRGGTVIWTSGAFPVTARYVDGGGLEHIVSGGCVSPTFVDSPAAGSYVYKITITTTVTGTLGVTAKVYSDTLVVTELKR